MTRQPLSRPFSLRLIVDLSEPNRYTQIAGISAGIPQINRVVWKVCDPPRKWLYLEKHLSDFEKGAYYYFGTVEQLEPFHIYSIERLRENTERPFGAKMGKLVEGGAE